MSRVHLPQPRRRGLGLGVGVANPNHSPQPTVHTLHPSLPRFLPLSASRAATTHLAPPPFPLPQKASRATSTLAPRLPSSPLPLTLHPTLT